jgi:hypothetical protein
MTRILFTIMLALVAAPAALADGPMPYATQDGNGVVVPGTPPMRYVPLGDLTTGATTTLAKISTADGSVIYNTVFPGSWGTPVLTYGSSTGEGLSHDRKTLVLEDVVRGFPHVKSSFLILSLPGMSVRETLELKGDFAFDAMSPRGDWLYLVQHVDRLDQTRYVVRKYDTISGKLLPGRVADRAQKSWVMKGYPMSRAVSADGRWVYTLYDNPGGFPFVHALDTVRGVAHCTGLPWHGKESAVYNMRLTLHGDALAVHWMSGKPWLRMDTRTWRLSPDHRSGFPWWTLLFVGLLPGAALALRRDRAAQAHKVFRVATRPG